VPVLDSFLQASPSPPTRFLVGFDSPGRVE
jgi:hypothetical protein